MNCIFAIGKSLAITGCCFSLAPDLGYLNSANTIDDQSKRAAVSLISHLPVKHVLDLCICDAGYNLGHNMRANIAAITHQSC